MLNRKDVGCMKTIVENVHFIQDGTMVFGDLYLENGYVERINYKTANGVNRIAAIGLVDLHTHGINGYTSECLDVAQLRDMALEYARWGVTSFAPTLRARPLQEFIPYLEAYRKAYGSDYHGARYVGAHLEGPYLNPAEAGNMDPSSFQKINIDELQQFLNQYHKDIAMMTIAPELENAQEAIYLLHLYGVEVSLGHTSASYEECQNAFREGASQITHLCNSMPALDHHERNMMDAVLLSDCACTIIFDHAHISDEMLKWLIPMLGTKRIIAISNGDERLRMRQTTLLDMFKDLYREYGLQKASEMCSLNASNLMKSYTNQIKLGRKVDLMVLDEHLNLQDVLMEGRSLIAE